MKIVRLLTSKTVLGVVAAVAGHLAAAPDVTLPVILNAVGIVLAAIGARDAIAKNGVGA